VPESRFADKNSGTAALAPDRTPEPTGPDRPRPPSPTPHRSRAADPHQPPVDTPDARPVALADRLPHRARRAPRAARTHLTTTLLTASRSRRQRPAGPIAPTRKPSADSDQARGRSLTSVTHPVHHPDREPRRVRSTIQPHPTQSLGGSRLKLRPEPVVRSIAAGSASRPRRGPQRPDGCRRTQNAEKPPPWCRPSPRRSRIHREIVQHRSALGPQPSAHVRFHMNCVMRH
jgi:hypothetical protein